ncbi:MAG: hypothetical protein F7C32_03225 [Desulfurococcales archaeon]|nr:hypothetical protein [Desulfurococcales archaeon]
MTRYLRVRGPGTAHVKCGETRLFGIPLPEDSKVVVPVGRTYIFQTETKDCIEPINTKVEDDPLGKELYKIAEDIVEKVVGEGWKRVYILGYSDTGKSTIATLVHNLMLSYHVSSSFVTIDVGQNEVHMPTFTSLIAGKPVFPGTRCSKTINCFVGSITPADAPERYIGCTWFLLDHTHGKPVIIDTDGWVSGPGSLYAKRGIIGMSKNVLLVATRFPSRMEEYLSKLGYEILKIRPLEIASKSREERIINRMRLVSNVFQSAQHVTIYLDEILLVEPRRKPRTPGHRLWEGHIAATYRKGKLSGAMIIEKIDGIKGKLSGYIIGDRKFDLVEVGIARFPNVVKSLRSML